MAELKKYLDTTALGTLVEKIKAEDAKVLQGAKDYADGLATNYDAAGSAAGALTDAKSYTDQLANGQVATNKSDIETLKGTGEGSVAKAIADAKALIDADIDGVEGKADKNAEDIAVINNTTTGILAVAKKYADDADAEVEAAVAEVAGDVEELAGYVGTFTHDTAKTVVEYINAKTDGIATSGNLEALGARVTAVEGDVTTIKGDYLKASDKTELQGKIDAEAGTRQSADEGLAARIKVVEDDYLKAADKTELQGNIDSLTDVVEALRDGVDADKVDGILDLIKYVEDHGPEVQGMQEDIAGNAEAIEGVAGRMTTAEGKITTLEGAVATKAEKTYVDEAIEALEGADEEQGKKIAALEAKFGGAEGSVEDMIADAKAAAEAAAAGDATTKANKALEDAKTYANGLDSAMNTRVAALEAIDHEHANKELLDTYTQTEANLADAVAKKHSHANESVLNGITADKVSAWDAAEGNAKSHATGLNTAMTTRVDGIEDRVEELEGAIVDKAETSALNAAIERIAKNETDIAANASAIGSFTAITSEEVAALFA